MSCRLSVRLVLMMPCSSLALDTRTLPSRCNCVCPHRQGFASNSKPPPSCPLCSSNHSRRIKGGCSRLVTANAAAAIHVLRCHGHRTTCPACLDAFNDLSVTRGRNGRSIQFGTGNGHLRQAKRTSCSRAACSSEETDLAKVQIVGSCGTARCQPASSFSMRTRTGSRLLSRKRRDRLRRLRMTPPNREGRRHRRRRA